MRNGILLLGLLASASVHAQWEHTGPFGAWTTCHARLSDHDLVGGTAGIFKSTDDAETWFPIGTGLPPGSIQALHHDGSVLYAGVDQEGLFRSLDDGQTWNPCNNAALGWPDQITGLSSYAGDLLVSCEEGRFRSSDQGLTFAPLGATADLPGEMIALGGDVIITRSWFNFPGNLYRSADGGTSWQPANTGLAAVPEIGALYANGADLYAFGKNVYRSTDQGLSWVQVTASPATYSVRHSCRRGDSFFFSTDGNLGVEVTRWDLGATSYANITAGLPDTWTTMLFTAGNDVLINKNGTLFRSANDGGTWSETAATGMAGVNALSVLADGSTVFCGAQEAIYRSTDAGAQWQRVASPPYADTWSFHKTGSTVLAGTSEGVLRSDDGGTTWPTVTLPSLSVKCFASGGGALFAGGSSSSSGAVMKSLNGGASWTSFSTGLPAQSVVLDLVTVGSTLFAGVGASSSAVAGVYRTSTATAGWTHLPNGMADLAGTALAHHDNHLYAGTENGVFRSADEGTSWTAIGSALSGQRVNDLSVVGANLVAATESGLFLLAPGTNDWQDITDDLQTAEPVALAAGSGFLFAATDGRSVARRALFTVGMAEAHAGSGITVAPNPVLDHLRLVGMTVAPGAPVVVRDATGREVLRLRASGGPDQTFDASPLDAGHYIITMETPTFTFVSRFSKS